MEKRGKRKTSILPILLACVLLITELPRVLNAADILNTGEQTEMQEPGNPDAEPEDGTKEDNQQDAQAGDKKVNGEENDKQEDTPEEADNKNEEMGKKQEEKTPEKKVGTAKALQKTTLAQTKLSDVMTAQDISPVPDTDPMYWMGQRTGGDTNRAMVWFGEYWQKDATGKSPLLWRTLRSDGQGNYGGAVTLLTEYGLNAVYFDKTTPYNQQWYSTSLGSSDLRAWMNGVGTGAMDGSADSGSRQGSDISYNDTAGGVGEIKGSFYANAFNSSEKNLIVPTLIEDERNSGGDVADKIFALSGSKTTSNTVDALHTAYFKTNRDRVCYSTLFARGAQTSTGAGVANGDGKGNTVWWLRSRDSRNTLWMGFIHYIGMIDSGVVNQTDSAARPSVNLAPSSIIFTSASADGDSPILPLSGEERIGLELSGGASSAFDTSLDGSPVYAQGGAYRIFSRNEEDSNLGISIGSEEGAIALSYPAGSAGQYINALVVNEAGEKWTGRVKHIENNEDGTFEFFVPQRKPGTSTTQNVRVFAWRETEETKTACVPNYQDLSLTEADSYKITYANGGGTNGAASMGTQSIVQGASAVLRPCTFKKTNNYFVGWRDESGEMYTDQETITPSGNLTLTAIWSNSYKTINYKPGNGSGSDVSFNAGTGSKVTLPNSSFTPPTGAEFVEWNTEADGSGTSYKSGNTVTLNDNLTLYAIYGTKATITYDANGGIGDSQSQTGYLEKEFTLKSDGFTRKGYTLKGWNTEGDGSGTGYELGDKVTLTGDCTLYAQWEAIGYKLAFDDNGATQGTAPADISLTYGGTATIPDTSIYRSEYVLDGWTVNSDGTGTVYKKDDTIDVDESYPTDGLTLYAKWVDADNYCITYDLNKPAAAADSDVEGTMPLDDLSCFADGINTKTTAATPVTKIKGYVFKGWSTSALTPPGSTDLTAPEAELTPTADLTLHAIWASATEWKVIYSGTATGVTGDFPKDDGPYYDDGFTYKATVKDNDSQTKNGHTFKGWSETQGSTTAEYTAGSEITLSGDLTLYAVWEANDCTVTYDRNASAGSGNAPSAQTAPCIYAKPRKTLCL